MKKINLRGIANPMSDNEMKLVRGGSPGATLWPWQFAPTDESDLLAVEGNNNGGSSDNNGGVPLPLRPNSGPMPAGNGTSGGGGSPCAYSCGNGRQVFVVMDQWGLPMLSDSMCSAADGGVWHTIYC